MRRGIVVAAVLLALGIVDTSFLDAAAKAVAE